MAKKALILLSLIIVALLVWFIIPPEYLTLEGLKEQRESLTAFSQENFALSVASYFTLYVVMTALSLPGAAILTLAGGAIFGLVTGLIVVSFASTLGATLAFLFARYLFRSTVENKFPVAIEKVNRGIEREGKFYLFGLRLFPGFPFFLVNLAMAFTSISAITFFWVSQLGMLPGTVAYVFAGTQLATVKSLGDVLSPGMLIAFAILAILPLVSKWILEYMRKRKLYAEIDKPENTQFNMVVLGAGSAGLVSSYIASAVKAKVALIERHKMGGDCLNTGCVPSKALIRSAKMLHEISRAKDFGFDSAGVEFTFSKVMDRVHSIIKTIEPHDSVERYTSLGVDCYEGEAKILDPYRVQVGEEVLTTQNIVIATGARPFVPELPGLDDITYYTSDTIWELRELPKKFVVLGGGAIGSELAQSFRRFGAEVSIIERGDRILRKEDPEASELLMDQFKKEGINLLTQHSAKRFEKVDGQQFLIADSPDGEQKIPFDAVLFALGRTANVTGFGLEELNIEVRDNGTVDADDFLRTNYPNIFVCGDVTGPFQFTHAAAHQAWYVAVNALFQPFKRYAVDYRVIPRATFTDPEVAHVGISEEEAAKKNIPILTVRYDINDLDRAITDSDAKGFVKVITRKGSDEILGATIVGVHAGDLLAEFVLAMKHRIGLNKILGTIHTYPTLAESNKFAAGVWKKETKPEWLLGYVKKFHEWRRGGA